MTMYKTPPKLSGLIKTGLVVPTMPVHELADIPGPGAPAASSTTPEALSSPIERQPQEVPAAAFNSGNGRNLAMIEVHLIDPNPLAPREVYTPEMILQRAEDLRSQGQHDPIHVIPNPDAAGRFIICDGWTRVQACREHKVFGALLAEIHSNLGMQESAWFGYEQNEGRSQHCDLDRAMFYEKLIASGETPAEVARNAEISKTQLTFYRAYSKLPPDVTQDGIVTRQDIRTLTELLNSDSLSYSAESQRYRGDTNNDGKITAADLLHIVNFLALTSPSPTAYEEE